MGNCYGNKYTIIISQISENSNRKKLTILWDIVGKEFSNYYFGYQKFSETEKKFFLTNVPASMIELAKTRVSHYPFMKIQIFEKNKIKLEIINN